MSAKRLVRLHMSDGKIRTESIEKMAMMNRCTVAEARELLALWVQDGALRVRQDGGYDVIRFKPRGADLRRARERIAARSIH